MSLGIDSSISKMPYGSCCLEFFCNTMLDFEFKLVSALKLLEVIEECIDLEMGPAFSSSIALDVLSSLTYMKFKHFIMLSDSLLGCQFWMLSSNRIELDKDFGGRSKEISAALRSLG